MALFDRHFDPKAYEHKTFTFDDAPEHQSLLSRPQLRAFTS